MQLAAELLQYREQRHAVRRMVTALRLITTGLAHRDHRIRTAILTELAGTSAYGELMNKPVHHLDAITATISTLGRRLRDGFAYDSLLELQIEALAIFARCERERG